MKGQFNINRYFGVEIEYYRPSQTSNSYIATCLQALGIETQLEAYNHETRPHWKIVSDSSVDSPPSGYTGYNEIVSPKLKGLEGLKSLKKVLEVLNSLDCKVNYACGIHIHHDVTNIFEGNKKESKKFLFNLIKWIAKFEHCIYKLVSPSRLDNRRYSTPVRESFNGFASDNKTNEINKLIKKDVARKHREYGNGVTTKNRYASPSIQRVRACGLNLKHVWTRGSIEFRYHNGSLNYNKIEAWIVTTQAIINVVETKGYVCLKYVENGRTGFNKFLVALGFTQSNRDGLVEKTKKYNRKRFKELSARESEYSRYNSYDFVSDGINN